MNCEPYRTREAPEEPIPREWKDLRDRVRTLPASERALLEPLLDDALEQAQFRGRVLGIAREALQRLRLDLKLTQFDLEATRREREQLRRAVEGRST